MFHNTCNFLITGAFVPGKPMSPEVLDATFEVLAHATSSVDSDDYDDYYPVRVAATKNALHAALAVGAKANSKMTTEDGQDAFKV